MSVGCCRVSPLEAVLLQPVKASDKPQGGGKLGTTNIFGRERAGMKRTILIVVLALIAASVAYCQHFWFPYTWHQKMTVEVEVDDQLYTGSSVVKVTVSDSDPLTKGLGFSMQFGATGEAAFVELPGPRYLFALLGGGPPDSGPQTNAINILKGISKNP